MTAPSLWVALRIGVPGLQVGSPQFASFAGMPPYTNRTFCRLGWLGGHRAPIRNASCGPRTHALRALDPRAMRAPQTGRRAKMAAVFAGSPWPESRRALIARRLLCVCFATLLWTLAPAGSALALGGGGVGGFGGGGGGGG